MIGPSIPSKIALQAPRRSGQVASSAHRDRPVGGRHACGVEEGAAAAAAGGPGVGAAGEGVAPLEAAGERRGRGDIGRVVGAVKRECVSSSCSEAFISASEPRPRPPHALGPAQRPRDGLVERREGGVEAGAHLEGLGEGSGGGVGRR